MQWAIGGHAAKRYTAVYCDEGLGEYAGGLGYASDVMHPWTPALRELRDRVQAWHQERTGREAARARERGQGQGSGKGGARGRVVGASLGYCPSPSPRPSPEPRRSGGVLQRGPPEPIQRWQPLLGLPRGSRGDRPNLYPHPGPGADSNPRPGPAPDTDPNRVQILPLAKITLK